MANSYPLDLVATPQVVPLAGAPGPFHNVTLSFDTAPSAGTALIEYRKIADPVWSPISHANGVTITSGFFQVRLDGAVAALRITFTGLVGGSGARIWDDINDMPGGLYNGRAAITTQPYTEANVKNGVQFYTRAVWPLSDSIAAGETVKVLFRTGVKPVVVKLRDFQYSAEEVRLNLFLGPTGVTGGDPLAIHNYNGRFPVATTCVATKNVTTAADGAEIDGGDAEHYFGATNAPQRNPGAIPAGRERILPPLTSYLISITNTGTGAARVQYFLDWYEGDTDIPL